MIDRQNPGDIRAVTEQAIIELDLLKRQSEAADQVRLRDQKTVFGRGQLDARRVQIKSILNDFGGSDKTAHDVIAESRRNNPTGWLNGKDTKFGKKP